MQPQFIVNLKSQRNLVIDLIGKGQHLVYCYLRRKDSGPAPQGTPYYFGIASTAIRPFQPHRWTDQTGRKRLIPVPPDEKFIRVVDSLPSRGLAGEREQFFIARYGRKRFEGGILINSGKGGESGSFGNKVPARRIREWHHVKAAARDTGVSPSEWVQTPQHQKAAWRVFLKRNPEKLLSLRDYLDQHYQSYDESRQCLGWQEVGASEEEWSKLTKRQRKTALERFDKGQPWNEDARQNPAPEAVQRRIQNSALTRIRNGANDIGMPEDEYAAISAGRRYDIKIWLEKNPGKTWRDYPIYGQHIPKGAANKRMIAAAKQYDVDLLRYSSLSDAGRRSLRKRHKNGKRGEDLFRGLK